MKAYKVVREDMTSVWNQPTDIGTFNHLKNSPKIKWEIGKENIHDRLFATQSLSNVLYWARAGIEEYRKQLPHLKIIEVECKNIINDFENQIVCESITPINEISIPELGNPPSSYEEYHELLDVLREKYK